MLIPKGSTMKPFPLDYGALVFTLKEHNRMLFGGISVQIKILTSFYYLTLSGQAKLSMASCRKIIRPRISFSPE